MATIKVPIGPFSLVMVQDHLVDEEMIQIQAYTTGDQEPTDATQTTRLPGLNDGAGKIIQLSRKVTVSLNFLSDDIIFYNLCQGLSVNNTDRSAAPQGDTYYSLLLIEDAREDEEVNIYLPKCKTERLLRVPKSKRNPTGIVIEFAIENENVNFDHSSPFDVTSGIPAESRFVHYKTVEDIITILGSRNPF